MIKKVSFVLILSLFGISQIFAAPCGDVNSSGTIDIVDALMTAQYYVNLDPAGFDPGAADVSGDGVINIIDALMSAQYYVGLIDSFPGCIEPVSPPPGVPLTYVLQAETDATWDNAAIESDHSGYTGDGYVNTANASGAWIEWNIIVTSDTNASCVFTYACADARSMDLSINSGTVASLGFPGAGSWTTWVTETADVILTAGSNTIRLTAITSGGAPNLDKLDITVYNGPLITPVPPTPTPTPGPATPTPDQSDWTNADPKELVKSGNPGNSKLVNYADLEIGNPTIGLEGTGTARTITGPIVVPPGVSYDGKGEILTAASNMGTGDQDEEQQPYFILLPGANLKNVTFTAPGVEGVHMMGFNKLENIVWQDVGEDAASVRSYFPGGIIYIEGGSVNSASDKVFQINSPCKVIVKNLRATNISKLLRQNESVPMDIVMDGIDASNVKTAIVMANTSSCTLRHRNVSGGSLTKGPVKILPWVDGISDWDGTMEWGGPGSE